MSKLKRLDLGFNEIAKAISSGKQTEFWIISRINMDTILTIYDSSAQNRQILIHVPFGHPVDLLKQTTLNNLQASSDLIKLISSERFLVIQGEGVTERQRKLSQIAINKMTNSAVGKGDEARGLASIDSVLDSSGKGESVKPTEISPAVKLACKNVSTYLDDPTNVEIQENLGLRSVDDVILALSKFANSEGNDREYIISFFEKNHKGLLEESGFYE